MNDGVLTIASVIRVFNEIELAESFRRVDHCLFAVFFGLIGEFAGRILYATREPGVS